MVRNRCKSSGTSNQHLALFLGLQPAWACWGDTRTVSDVHCCSIACLLSRLLVCRTTVRAVLRTMPGGGLAQGQTPRGPAVHSTQNTHNGLRHSPKDPKDARIVHASWRVVVSKLSTIGLFCICAFNAITAPFLCVKVSKYAPFFMCLFYLIIPASCPAAWPTPPPQSSRSAPPFAPDPAFPDQPRGITAPQPAQGLERAVARSGCASVRAWVSPPPRSRACLWRLPGAFDVLCVALHGFAP